MKSNIDQSVWLIEWLKPSFFPFLLCHNTPDFIVKRSWKTHDRSKDITHPVCAASSFCHKGSAQQPVCGLDGQSVITADTANATGPRFIRQMTGQSNLPVSEPHIFFHTHACTHTKTHCPHWFAVDCRRDTIYKRPPGCTLFVCLHLWLRFGSLRSPLSCLIHSAKVKIQFYVRLYLELSCKNKSQIQALLIQGFADWNQVLHV